MRRTFITTMPDQAGAFLVASRIVAGEGARIVRVSYNKAVDTHALFLEVDGDASQLASVERLLGAAGYLESDMRSGSVVLLEFEIPDVSGGATPVLELIGRFSFNISYLSSRSDGSGTQHFKMGIFVEDPSRLETFLREASALCPVAVLDYDRAEKVLDNSIFYISFANELSRRMGLSAERREGLVIDANRLMQVLDDRGRSVHRTFGYISGFADSLARNRGEAFAPRMSDRSFGGDTYLTLIEPPCGSNTCVIRHGGGYLVVDTGFACYREEMSLLLHELFPDFDDAKKICAVTHADADHCGLLGMFDEVLASRISCESLAAEARGLGGIRESNEVHAPYIGILKALTSYVAPDPARLRAIGGEKEPPAEPLAHVADWEFGSLRFEVWEGAGGHLPGEIVLVERARRFAFSGDILINVHDAVDEQRRYNRFAPYLTMGVDTDPGLARRERVELSRVLGPGAWTVYGGHGAPIDLSL